MDEDIPLPGFNEWDLGLVMGVFGVSSESEKRFMKLLFTGLSIYNNTTHGVPWCT